MLKDDLSDAELAALLSRTEQATSAFMRGEMETYLDLTPHVPGFTFVNPFGGAPIRNEDRAASVRAIAGHFRGGSAKVELISAHVSGDLLVLVMIERQHGSIGGLPDQDWSLRVTQVYRRVGGDWRVIHRHADPLTRDIGLEAAAALARG